MITICLFQLIYFSVPGLIKQMYQNLKKKKTHYLYKLYNL